MANRHEVGKYHAPPDLADMEAEAREAFASIPEHLRKRVEGVGIRVVDFPDDETLEEMGCESPFDLLGLYSGIDMTRRSVGDLRHEPDIIYLYRRPILDYWCETGEGLAEIVRHVLIHEIGHHFGFSDADMDRIEREA